jgi:AmmeMemoRadiSam system protein A
MAISAEDRSALVKLARAAVEARVTNRPATSVDSPVDLLDETRGCFVTLTNSGRLRGCIGVFQPGRPLGDVIPEMGAAAAQDPRFVYDPIIPAELRELTVEVSILSPLEPTDHPEKLEVGTHGIYIVRGPQSGCFLPEVASDQGWDAVEFLSQCCMGKAGLPADAWRDPATTVYLFTSEKFDR